MSRSRAGSAPAWLTPYTLFSIFEMNLKHAKSPLDDGRDIVIYPRGATWGFRLPKQHTITAREEDGVAYLSAPDHGSAYQLERIEEVEGEVRIHLGFPTDNAHAIGTGHVPEIRPYSFPEIQHELDRLKTDFVSLGGRPQEAEAWAQGATHESHTAELRTRVRGLRQAR